MMKIINVVLYVVFIVAISVSVLELMLRYIYTPDALMVRMSVNESTYERLKGQKKSPAFDKPITISIRDYRDASSILNMNTPLLMIAMVGVTHVTARLT